MGHFDEIPHGCPFVITIADGHVTDVAVLPHNDKDSSPRQLRLRVFFSVTQQEISPDRLHPRLKSTVVLLRLVAVYLSLRDRRCIDQGQTGWLHFHLCGNLWCMWHKIVMFLVFSCLKLGNRVSSCKKRRSPGWTLMSVVFVHGISRGRGNRNQNYLDWKESSKGSSEKIVPPSNIINEGGTTIRRCRRGG